MATIAEITQQLINNGIAPIAAQEAAAILADPPPINYPSGGVWDTLLAKGFTFQPRPLGVIPRFLKDPTRNVIVLTVNGISTIYLETPVANL